MKTFIYTFLNLKEVKKEKLTVFIILIGIIIFHIINNYIISSIDLAPLFYDSGEYIHASFRIFSLLKEYKFFEAFSFHSAECFFLFPTLSFPFYLFFGLNQKSALMTNYIFLIILVFSTYAIGRLLYSRNVGILSAFIVTSFPGIFSASRTYMMDFALTSVVTLSAYFLLKTKEFTQKKFSVLLGLAFGLSMAIRPSFIIFFLGPFFIYLFISIKHFNDKCTLFEKLKNFIIFFIVSSILIIIFYVPHFSDISTHQLQALSVVEDNLNYFDSENVLFYIKGLFGIQLLYFYFILFCIFSAVVLFKRGDWDKKALLFSWFLVPYSFFTFYVLTNKDLRFVDAYLPAIALIISIGLFNIKKLIIRKILISLIIFVSLSQFIVISYDLFQINSSIDMFNKKLFDLEGYFAIPAYSIFERPHAYKTDYDVNLIVDYFKKSERISQKNKILYVDAAEQISRPVQYLIFQNDSSLLKKEFIYQAQFTLPELKNRYPENYYDKFTLPPENTDLLILLSDLTGEYSYLNDFITENMNLIKIIPLKNNRSLYVFENIH